MKITTKLHKISFQKFFFFKKKKEQSPYLPPSQNSQQVEGRTHRQVGDLPPHNRHMVTCKRWYLLLQSPTTAEREEISPTLLCSHTRYQGSIAITREGGIDFLGGAWWSSRCSWGEPSLWLSLKLSYLSKTFSAKYPTKKIPKHQPTPPIPKQRHRKASKLL